MAPQVKSRISIILVLYALLAWPLFYFVYKFGNPLYGTNDFFSYYKLYRDWDIGNVDAPFNMRLLSSVFIYLLNKAGLHYDTMTAFDQFPLDKQVFFNAILFNYICVVATCATIFATLRRHLDGVLLPFIGGLLFLLGFGTVFFELMPITDALSIFLFAIIFKWYLEKNRLLFIPLVLLIVQREYIFLALAVVALIDLLAQKQRYYLWVLISCILCFGVYFVLRKTIFYTPKYDFQASPDFFSDSIMKLKFPLLPYIKQTLMTMNISILYVLLLCYKKYKVMEIDRQALLKFVLLFAQINIISIAAVFGNNTGRYFYILVPFVIFYCIKEAAPLLQDAEGTLK
jgi:hypothetical protein